MSKHSHHNYDNSNYDNDDDYEHYYNDTQRSRYDEENRYNDEYNRQQHRRNDRTMSEQRNRKRNDSYNHQQQRYNNNQNNNYNRRRYFDQPLHDHDNGTVDWNEDRRGVKQELRQYETDSSAQYQTQIDPQPSSPRHSNFASSTLECNYNNSGSLRENNRATIPPTNYSNPLLRQTNNNQLHQQQLPSATQYTDSRGHSDVKSNLPFAFNGGIPRKHKLNIVHYNTYSALLHAYTQPVLKIQEKAVTSPARSQI